MAERPFLVTEMQTIDGKMVVVHGPALGTITFPRGNLHMTETNAAVLADMLNDAFVAGQAALRQNIRDMLGIEV